MLLFGLPKGRRLEWRHTKAPETCFSPSPAPLQMERSDWSVSRSEAGCQRKPAAHSLIRTLHFQATASTAKREDVSITADEASVKARALPRFKPERSAMPEGVMFVSSVSRSPAWNRTSELHQRAPWCTKRRLISMRKVLPARDGGCRAVLRSLTQPEDAETISTAARGTCGRWLLLPRTQRHTIRVQRRSCPQATSLRHIPAELEVTGELRRLPTYPPEILTGSVARDSEPSAVENNASRERGLEREEGTGGWTGLCHCDKLDSVLASVVPISSWSLQGRSPSGVDGHEAQRRAVCRIQMGPGSH
ncbi:hypothetical protein Z043_115408 [Scleropages formosus]|uniref:Uncharacterized protein n=1 Tax=Scleropages formosus TaxID=113540 RepID=A0A0P7WWN3_SCLFO|nr:hypothetical protein Z043_115408 [Scleropages formosus]